ncbi:hypothetical protein [Streptomyces sp. MS2.AVA.5]|uniref:Uncharacterized protein n=1 Tax=Streptomyces achmelvichensis TaxID=3134111 RepID=A0ACC6Q1E5_9ACTN
MFEQSLAQILGAASAAGVAGIHPCMAAAVEPAPMRGDDGTSGAAPSLKPAPVDEWTVRQPWRTRPGEPS